MDIKEGDHFTVTINGVEHDTVIDEHGTQRFVSNPIVEAFVEATQIGYDRWLDANPIGKRVWTTAPFTLNDISYVPGEPYTLNQLIEFSALHGYSVGGMCDLSFMDGVEVLNPLWKE